MEPINATPQEILYSFCSVIFGLTLLLLVTHYYLSRSVCTELEDAPVSKLIWVCLFTGFFSFLLRTNI